MAINVAEITSILKHEIEDFKQSAVQKQGPEGVARTRDQEELSK